MGALDREDRGAQRRVGGTRGEERLEVRPRLDEPSRPSERAANAAPARPGEGACEEAAPGPHAASRWPARQRHVVAPSSFRSRFRWRGLFVVTARTWSATFPSTIRGTSTWPRSARTSRSRPQRSESAWRSAMNSVAWSAAASGVGGGGAGRPSGFSRRSVRPTSQPPTGRAAAPRPRPRPPRHPRRRGQPPQPGPRHPPRTLWADPDRVRVGR